MTSNKQSQKNSINRLLDNLDNYHRLIYAAISCSVLNKIFDLAPPVLIGLSVDVIVREQSSWLGKLGVESVTNQLIVLAFLSFLIWTAESFFEYLYGILWRNLAQSTQHNLRINAYKHLQELEMSFFEEDSSGRLLSILNDDINQLERFLDHGANQIIQLLVTVFLVGGAMAFLAPGVAFFAFLPIPLILFGSIYFQNKLAPRYKDVREKAGNISSRLSNNIGGMLTIKSYTTESLELDRLRIESNLYRNSNRKAIKLSAAFIPLIRFAILFAFLAILIIGGVQASKGLMEVGTYSFLVFITQRLLWPLTTLGHTLDEYQRSMASTNRVLNLLDTPIITSKEGKPLNPKEVNGEIKFENIKFNYNNRSILLNNFNLTIPSGSTYGIVGSTGSGKSTIVKLMLRLYPLISGRILLDGEPIDKISLRNLRQCISLVSQEFYLFHGTIAENISYGKSNASISEITRAAEMAEAYSFIKELPHEFDTVVGERGQKLSGGQRQRIALARSFLKDAPIMIFDEATASVDNETEAAIQRSLLKITAKKTTIIIAHRLSTVRHADKIVVLENGEIMDIGTHDELIKKSATYISLWRVQAGIQESEDV